MSTETISAPFTDAKNQVVGPTFGQRMAIIARDAKKKQQEEQRRQLEETVPELLRQIEVAALKGITTVVIDKNDISKVAANDFQSRLEFEGLEVESNLLHYRIHLPQVPQVPQDGSKQSPGKKRKAIQFFEDLIREDQKKERRTQERICGGAQSLLDLIMSPEFGTLSRATLTDIQTNHLQRTANDNYSKELSDLGVEQAFRERCIYFGKDFDF